MRSPSQPEASEPTMLNRPITAMVQPPTSRRQAAIDQIGRQVHGDEGELEAAGEEAEHQQHIGAMPERLRQRLPQRLRSPRHAGPCARRGGVASASDSGSTSSIADAEDQQRGLPAERVDQRDARAARTGTGRTSRPRCRRRRRSERQLLRHQLAERADHHDERAAGKPEADQHAGREIEHPAASSHTPSGRGRAHRAARRRTARAPCRSGRRSRRRTAGRRPTAGSGWRARTRRRRGPSRWPGDIGVRNRPSAERGPKVISAITQPHRTITAGVRQPMLVTRGTEGDEMAMAEPV